MDDGFQGGRYNAKKDNGIHDLRGNRKTRWAFIGRGGGINTGERRVK